MGKKKIKEKGRRGEEIKDRRREDVKTFRHSGRKRATNMGEQW